MREENKRIWLMIPIASLILFSYLPSIGHQITTEPALTYTTKTQPASFIPPMYEGPEFAFTEDIYININTAPGHNIGILLHDTSYWLSISPLLEIYLYIYEESGFQRIVKSNPEKLVLGDWAQLSVVHDPTFGIRTYKDGRMIIENESHPRILEANSKFYLINHLDSAESTDGVIYLRNIRLWKQGFSSSDVDFLKNCSTLKENYRRDLLLWAPMNDGKSGGHHATMIDYSDSGMHLRGDASNTFTTVETYINPYKPNAWSLNPTSADVKFNISQLGFPSSYVFSFWMKFDTYVDGAEIISGSLHPECPRDTKITLIQNSNWYLRNQNYVYNTPHTVRDLRTISAQWLYYHYSKDGMLTGYCQNYDIAGTAKWSYDCSNNYYIHFCDQIILYKSLAITYFQHITLFLNSQSTSIIRYLQFSKYLIYIHTHIYIYIYVGYIATREAKEITHKRTYICHSQRTQIISGQIESTERLH